jgi:hypothetical protein
MARMNSPQKLKDTPMHSVLLTFTPKVSEAEFMQKAGPRLKEAHQAEGLIMKIYMDESPERWAGLYLFDTEANASAHFDSGLYTWLEDSGLITDVEIRRYLVDDQMSTKMGTPGTPLRQAAA